MRGVVFTGHRKLKLMSFGDPVPGDDEVALEMKASGFCGSDLRHYRGERGASGRGESAKFLAEHRLAFDTPHHRGSRSAESLSRSARTWTHERFAKAVVSWCTTKRAVTRCSCSDRYPNSG